MEILIAVMEKGQESATRNNVLVFQVPLADTVVSSLPKLSHRELKEFMHQIKYANTDFYKRPIYGQQYRYQQRPTRPS